MVIQQTVYCLFTAVWWLKENPTYTMVEMVEIYFFQKYHIYRGSTQAENINNCVILDIRNRVFPEKSGKLEVDIY
jgi:hypothetical protein